MTRRRWIADEWTETSAVLKNDQAAHLARVLRAQAGQQFDIVAGEKVRRGIIQGITDETVEFSLHEELDATGSLPLVIALSIIRFERMEWAIEKLTELGVEQIVPVVAQRSEKHLAQAAAKRVERWRKIARESAQQSRRSNVPEISEPIHLPEWLKKSQPQEPQYGLRLLLSEHEQSRSLREIMEAQRLSSAETSAAKITAAIGPEGGWTEAECTRFRDCGWQPITLGPRILRAETAAMAFASVVNAWLAAPSAS